MATRVVTRSTTLPVQPGELRSWLRYDDAAQLPDDQARSLILSAVSVIEGHLARFFFTTDVEEKWYFPGGGVNECRVRLKYGDVAQALSLSADDGEGTVTAIDVDTEVQIVSEDGAAFLAPPFSESWPAAVLDAWTLTLTYQSRMYASAEEVDEGLRRAVCVLCGWMDRYREEAGLPEHVRTLLEPYERGDY